MKYKDQSKSADLVSPVQSQMEF